jgi:hypothetical protein
MSDAMTFKQMVEYSGLSDAFLRKVIGLLKYDLNPWIKKGDKNADLYQRAAICAVLDQIKSLRDNQQNAAQIARTVREKLPENAAKQEEKHGKTRQNSDQTGEMITLVSQLSELKDDAHATELRLNRALADRDIELAALKQKNRALQESMTLLLPDYRGREDESPAEAARRFVKEAERDRIEREQLALQIKAAEEAKSQAEQDQAKAAKAAEQRRALLDQIAALDGKWFKAGERKRLLDELKALG